MSFVKVLWYLDEKGVSLEDVASKLGLSKSTVRKYLYKLIEMDFVEKKDGLFALTRLGLMFRRSIDRLKKVSEVEPYVVTDVEGKPIPLAFKNYRQLLAIIETGLVSRDVLEIHLKKYMCRWLRDSLGDEYLAYLIESGAVKTLDDLKKYIDQIMQLIKGVKSD